MWQRALAPMVLLGLSIFALAAPTAKPTIVRGTVAKVSGKEVDLKTANGEVRVKLSQPFRVYARVPGSLAEVKNSSFVGVTSVKQPDGTERATEIHVFAPELRGMGEGSHMMSPSPCEPYSGARTGEERSLAT